jgi:hypothetical protein
MHFSFRESEGEPFDGQMLADDILRFELEPDGPGCIRLTVTFPEYGKSARDAAGWHVCLEQLTHVLDGTPRPGSRRTAGAWSTVDMSSASAPWRRPQGHPRSGSASTARMSEAAAAGTNV